MTAQALKNVATAAQAAPSHSEPAKSLSTLLQSRPVINQLAKALPNHLSPDRMARIVLTELRKNPKLQHCEPMSFMGAVLQCAQLGLEPGSALGHAYILPFEKRAKVDGQWLTQSVEAQLILGYRGMIDLARRSGQILSIEAREVYACDEFSCTLGMHSDLHHKPAWHNADRTQSEQVIFVYAVAKLKDGGHQFEVMSRAQIDAIRSRSKSADSGPWVTDYVAMALKTVIRRLFKFLPVSIEMQRAIVMDERAEADISQELSTVIDADFQAAITSSATTT
jgi:recombination protein RecT